MLFTGASEATNTIAEWQPIKFIGVSAALMYVLIFVSFAFKKGVRELEKKDIYKLLIISFWGIGLLKWCRLTPIFIFTVLLWGYEYVREFITYIVNSFKLEKVFKVVSVGAIIASMGFVILTMVMGIKWVNYYYFHSERELMQEGYPYGCIKYLKDHNVTTKIYNDDWGSWMLFNDIPTFMDGRCDPFVEEFSPGNNQFIEAANADSLDDYLELFEKYDIEYAFLKYDKDTKTLLESTGKWETVVAEKRAMLLKRTDVE